MDNKKQAIPIEEFLDIYPKLSLKFEIDEKDKLIKYFNIKNNVKRKRTSIISDEEQMNKFMKNKKNSLVSTNNSENKEIVSIQKLNNNINRNSVTTKEKILYRVSHQEEDIEKYVDKLNEDLYLINKGIELQKRNLKRTNDIKKALELFFEKSELIQKVTKNYGINNSNNNFKDNTIDQKQKYRIRKIISNLSDNVLFEKYEKNKFIIRRNDIAKDCYILISGRVSILKPVEYKYIKISYEDYFKYLLNLLNNNEQQLFETVMNINYNFINTYNKENFFEIIKYYVRKRISFYSNISYELSDKNIKENLNLEKIESFLSEYSLKFEDFELSKEKIISDLKKIETTENSNDSQFIIDNYFRDIFKITKSLHMQMNLYDFIFDSNDTENIRLVTLYKYESFLTLSPGVLFGEMSFNSENKRRNASIRAETDCVVASLSIEKYANYLLDESKKILAKNINFLCNNFFFNNVSQKIFIKYYFPMFKLINLMKDNTIYKQESSSDSLHFIMNGSLKYEINASISEIHNLILFLITELRHTKDFKLNNDYIEKLKRDFLKNHDLITMRNSSVILLEKIQKIQKFELSISESYEVLGLPEFFFELPHFFTCSVISDNAKIFEISNKNVKKIISYENSSKDELNKMALDKIIVFIKKLFNIETTYISSINTKISTNMFEIFDTVFFSNINYERNSILKKNDENSSKKLDEEEKKNKKYINKNEELLIIKKFSKSGYVNDDIIKNNAYTPLKIKKKVVNPKLLSNLKNLNSSRSFPILNLRKIYEENKSNAKINLNKKSNIKNNNNNRHITEEKKVESGEKKKNSSFVQNKFISNKINSDRNINENSIFSNLTQIKSPQQTFINIGKSIMSLPKLKKLIIESSKPKDQINLSIIKNNFDNMSQISEHQQNMALIENNIINNNNDKIVLPELKRQTSCLLFPIKKRLRQKLLYVNKSYDYRENKSEVNKPDNRNILVKYIKNYYQKQKIKGYSAIINPNNNTLFRKKVNKNILNLLKK